MWDRAIRFFVSFPDGRTMLTDDGGAAGAERLGGYQPGIDVGEQVVSPYLWSRGVKKLDVVLLSHAHHAGGKRACARTRSSEGGFSEGSASRKQDRRQRSPSSMPWLRESP
ncbi:MAG: hypothetical protein WBD73_02650 [Candidatus Acidiferrales bacterium]